MSGHSLGAEKAVYYMNKGKYADNINAVILLAPADSYGYNEKLLGKAEMNRLREEAGEIIRKGNGEVFLTSNWLCHGGVLPKGADSFLNFFSEKSELSTALPLRCGKDLSMYQNIHIPILVLIGDQKEYTSLDLDKAVLLLKTENKLANVYQIKDCNHDFEYKEDEVARHLIYFLKEKGII